MKIFPATLKGTVQRSPAMLADPGMFRGASRNSVENPKSFPLLPRKLAYFLKNDAGWKMNFLLKWSFSRGHVHFPGCIFGRNQVPEV